MKLREYYIKKYIRLTARKEKILLLCIICFVLQNPISIFINVFDYYDEILTCICWGILFYKVLVENQQIISVPKWQFKICSYVIIICIIGVSGNIAFGFQSIMFIILDIFSFSKFFAGLLLGYYFCDKEFSEQFKKKITRICKFFAIIHFLLALHEQLFTPWFDYLSEYQYVKSIKLFYSNQTYLVSYSVFVLALLILFGKSKREKAIYGIMIIFPMILTMRSKSWGFLIVFFVFTIMTKKIRFPNPLILGCISLPLVLFVAREKINLYFFTSIHYSPRLIVLKDGFYLASKYFPVGTGFGTFCSPGATLGGSKVYDMLGTNYSSAYIADAIHDMYWGYMLGQFGYIGAIAIILILVEIVLKCWELQKKSREYFLAGMCLAIYIIIATIGESPFFSSYAIGYSFLLGSLLKNKK